MSCRSTAYLGRDVQADYPKKVTYTYNRQKFDEKSIIDTINPQNGRLRNPTNIWNKIPKIKGQSHNINTKSLWMLQRQKPSRRRITKNRQQEQYQKSRVTSTVVNYASKTNHQTISPQMSYAESKHVQRGKGMQQKLKR